ncbi:hypothetical protein [Kribbella sp. CA-294648]|uniref:hypothetical protein n=1 Tax=Kribbella sp. CA-294648 TaxID=3239948 RepID=UPI003D91E21E
MYVVVAPVRMKTPARIHLWVFSRYDELRRSLSDPRLSSRSAPSAHVIPNVDLEHGAGSVAILQFGLFRHVVGDVADRRQVTGQESMWSRRCRPRTGTGGCSPDPDRIDVTRQIATHLGSGAGRHRCLG